MSFDLGVWYESAPITNEEATQKYDQLAERELTDATEHVGVERFLEDLCARYPDLDELPEDEID